MSKVAPYGTVRLQILDESGKPLERFSYQESIPFSGDSLDYKPQWKGGRSLHELLGQRVYVESEMTEGELYAIRGQFHYVDWVKHVVQE